MHHFWLFRFFFPVWPLLKYSLKNKISVSILILEFINMKVFEKKKKAIEKINHLRNKTNIHKLTKIHVLDDL